MTGKLEQKRTQVLERLNKEISEARDAYMNLRPDTSTQGQRDRAYYKYIDLQDKYNQIIDREALLS